VKVNDPLVGLDEIPWARLNHGYGSAADVPGLLRDVQAGVQPGPRFTSLALLWNKIVHQGTRYEATPFAVPFLTRLALDPRVPNRPPIVRLLAGIAIGLDNNHLPDCYDPTEDRANLAVVRAETDDWEGTLDRWIAEAPDERQRELRRQRRHEHHADDYLHMAEAPVLSYDAVQAELPALIGLLHADSAELRTATAYLSAWFPESAKTLTPMLIEFVESERLSGPAATGIVALGLLGNADVVPFIRDYLAAGNALVSGLARSTGVIAGQGIANVLFGLLFPEAEEPPVPVPSFVELDERRQRFLRTVAERKFPWSGIYRPGFYLAWGIPKQRAELRAYVGLAPDDSCHDANDWTTG
jgi:hypothetical protein